ncbi:MAG: TetR/AcrR family transcriptional regulator [Nannocystaceae bacterium]|nr:TetR/AcrR family transcriptional regulator [Nannocystaceae bacterium]
MARARQFDLDAATATAMALFWRRGYTATSVRELCDAMGVQPGSFYAAFGSKHGCFRAALERYLATQARAMPGAATPGPDAIVAWLRAIVSPSRRPRGCLLVNTAVEGPNLDPTTRRFVAARLRAMEQFFARCLGGRPESAARAAVVGSGVIAIHVQARAGATPATLRALADRTLAAVGLPGLDDG